MKLKQTEAGHWIIDDDSHIGKWVEETGKLAHDEWLFKKLKEHGVHELCGTCLDIGAYIGDHTAQYAEWFDWVLAYEPNPLAYKALWKNCGKIPNVLPIEAAIGNPERDYTMKYHGRNYGTATLVEAKEGDELVAFVQPKMFCIAPAFIKIDVEGAELTVLLTLEPIIEREHPMMLIEQRSIDGNEKLVRAFLDKHGYKYESIQGEYGHQYDLICK